MLLPLMVLTGLAILVGSVVKAPYGMLSPGSARPIAPLLNIGTPKVYKHDGEVLFVTVSVNSPPHEPTYMWALLGWLDPASDVFPTKVVTDGRSGQEDAAYQAILMETSQESAAYQALKEAGYPVSQIAAGAILSQIEKGGPSDGKLMAGDTVVAIGDTVVNNSNDVGEALREHKVGDVVDITVQRLGQPDQHVAVKLGSRVDQTGATVPFLGVYLETRVKYRLPFEVTINTGDVGGPSAGLAFTLAIIERLSSQDITHGHKVAVTGTIEPDGKVGNVGGVKQKTLAVRSSGADVFLVPADEYEEAAKYAGDDLKIIKVTSLDDALTALSNLPEKKPVTQP